MDIEVTVGQTRHRLHHFFTFFRGIQKLEDLYVDVPWDQLEEEGNKLTIHNPDPEFALLVHRVYINAGPCSHKEALQTLPPLPSEPAIRVGYDSNTVLTSENQPSDAQTFRLWLRGGIFGEPFGGEHWTLGGRIHASRDQSFIADARPFRRLPIPSRGCVSSSRR